MKKLSESLTESRFVDLINKKFTGETRKEDMIGNLQKLKPVDIGTSVLWADDDLRDDGTYYFTFDEVTDMLKDSEWRLPTVSEVEELKNCKKDLGDGEYIFTINDKSLTFYGHGCINVSPGGEIKINADNLFYGWTADVSKYNNNNYICPYLIKPKRFIVDRKVVRYKKCLLSARLVKDK